MQKLHNTKLTFNNLKLIIMLLTNYMVEFISTRKLLFDPHLRKMMINEFLKRHDL